MIKKVGLSIFVFLFLLVLTSLSFATDYTVSQTEGMEYNNVTYERVSNTHLDVNESSLVGYWSFDADTSSTAYDITSSNNNGAYTGNAFSTEASSGYGKSVSLDGNGDYVDLGDPSELEGMAELTIATWVYNDVAPTTAAEGYVGKDGASSDRSYYLSAFLSGSDYVHRFLVSDDCSVTDNLNSAIGDFQLNTWQHVVATYDGSYLRMYVDGVESSNVSTVDATDNICSSTENVYIGMRAISAPTTQLDGKLDEVMIFNESLSATEISAIYNNQSSRFKESGNSTYSPKFTGSLGTDNGFNVSLEGSAYQDSTLDLRLDYWNTTNGYNNSLYDGMKVILHADGNNTNYGTGSYTITNYGNTDFDTDGVWNQSADFDGSGDYIRLQPSPTDLNDYAVAFWVYFDDTSGSRGLFSTGQLPTHNNPGTIIQRTSSNIRVYSPGNGYSSNYPISTGEWYHMVVTDDGSSEELYINGIEKYSRGSASNYPYNAYTYFATSYGGQFNGKQDEMIIFDAGINQSRVTELYTRGLANWTEGETKTLEQTGDFTLTANDYLAEGAETVSPMLQYYSTGFYTPYVGEDLTLTSTFINPTKIIVNITIDYPVNGTTYVNEVDALNFTLNNTDDLGTCWYNVGGSNISNPSCTNVTGIAETTTGNHTWYVYANNTDGYVTNASVTFTISEIFNFTIVSPSEGEVVGGVSVPVVIASSHDTATYTYDLYKEFYGVVASNVSYIPNSSISIVNSTGTYNLTMYGTNNGLDYNASVTFIYVANTESNAEEQLNMIAIILGILLFAGILLYAGNSVKTSEIPKGRIMEKVLLYISGVSFAIVGLVSIYLYIANNSEYSYYAGLFYVAMVLGIILLIAIAGFYCVHVVEQVFAANKEEENGEE